MAASSENRRAAVQCPVIPGVGCGSTIRVAAAARRLRFWRGYRWKMYKLSRGTAAILGLHAEPHCQRFRHRRWQLVPVTGQSPQGLWFKDHSRHLQQRYCGNATQDLCRPSCGKASAMTTVQIWPLSVRRAGRCASRYDHKWRQTNTSDGRFATRTCFAPRSLNEKL